QVWGPRHSVFVVPKSDVATFTLARLPDDAAGLRSAEDLAARLRDYLGGRRMSYWEAGRGLGVRPNSLRFAAATGTVLIRWEGARRPTVWTLPRPSIEPRAARLELARRHLHVYGPTTAEAFGRWSGLKTRRAAETFDALQGSLVPVRTPIGEAWILASD